MANYSKFEKFLIDKFPSDSFVKARYIDSWMHDSSETCVLMRVTQVKYSQVNSTNENFTR